MMSKKILPGGTREIEAHKRRSHNARIRIPLIVSQTSIY